MLRKIVFLLLVLAGYATTYAQGDSSHLRISLLTCGPGDNEVYEVFGHTAVRVIDSINHTDDVYNYGTFEYGPDFEMQFMRGKLLYCVEAYPYYSFVQEYVTAGRSIEEQELLLSGRHKERIRYFLEWNADPENKYYKYDFFFDNCATRIRDIFPRPEIFGKSFRFGPTLPGGKPMSYRTIMNRYFYRDHWTRLGVNLLLGSRIDKDMGNAGIMFLPDYLRDGVAGASVNGKKIATSPVLILAGKQTGPPPFNAAMLLTVTIAVLTIAGLCIKNLKLLGRIMSVSLLVVTGLLGILMLLMWFATDHQGCGNNFNLLWCLPANVIIFLLNARNKARYAVIAIVCIFISVLLHITGIQCLIPEMFPLQLALLFIFGTIFRHNQPKNIINVPKD